MPTVDSWLPSVLAWVFSAVRGRLSTAIIFVISPATSSPLPMPVELMLPLLTRGVLIAQDSFFSEVSAPVDPT